MSDDDLVSANINIWQESLDTFVSSFFGVIADVIHVFILVRFLDQSQVGIFFVSYAFLYLFAQIPRGFGIAIRKRASEINNGRSKYLWCGFILIIPTLAILYSTLWLVSPIFNQYSTVDISRKVLVSLFFATTGFSTLEFARYYMAGCGYPGLVEKLRTTIAKTSMPVITVIFLYLEPTVYSALIAVFISYFTTSIIIFWKSPHKWNAPNKEVIIDILKFSKWSLLTSLLNDFYHRWDTILLGVMVSSAAVSYYDSSIRIAFLSVTLAVGISKTSNVKMSGLLEVGGDIKNISNKTFTASSLLIFPFLIVFSLNSEYLLKILYGGEYINGKWYLIIVIVQQIFQGYRMQFESIFNSSDDPNKTTKASLFSVIFNVITAPILVIHFGGLGVLYSTILSEFVRIITYEIYIKNLFGSYLIPKGALMQYISFGIIFSILHIFNHFIHIKQPLLFIISILFGVFGFYAIQYIISEETREIVCEYFNE